jgi:hypothetical protein
MVTGEKIKRSLGHRDYGMYGYDLRYNTVMGAHDITLVTEAIVIIVTDMIQVFLSTIH